MSLRSFTVIVTPTPTLQKSHLQYGLAVLAALRRVHGHLSMGASQACHRVAIEAHTRALGPQWIAFGATLS